MQRVQSQFVQAEHLGSRTTTSAFRLRCSPRPSIALTRRSVCTSAMFGGLMNKGSLAFLTVANNRPHPDKLDKGGEDAWFIRTDANGGAFGVADGVGGYDEYGVDSGLFSKRLMQLAAEKDMQQASSPDPKAIIEYAHRATLLPGACTACVIQLKGGRIYAANLGDSGFILIRGGKEALASTPLQHYFDCPYQLNNSETAPSDTSEDATMYELDVKEGDIIVAASDGLFDNVFTDDIISITTTSIAGALKAGKSQLVANETAAAALSELAYKHSQDKKFASPYATECNKDGANLKAAQSEKLKSGGLFGKALGGVFNAVQSPIVVGGKLDDITVLVSVVTSAGAAKGDLAAAALKAEKGLTPVKAQLASGMRILQAKQESDKVVTRKKVVRSGQAKIEGAGITAADVENMDKATIQKMLMKYDLPTSGALPKLKDRLINALS